MPTRALSEIHEVSPRAYVILLSVYFLIKHVGMFLRTCILGNRLLLW